MVKLSVFKYFETLHWFFFLESLLEKKNASLTFATLQKITEKLQKSHGFQIDLFSVISSSKECIFQFLLSFFGNKPLPIFDFEVWMQ